MNRLLTVALTLLLVGCASVPPAEDVSYPVQTEENVQEDVQVSESESETVDAPIVEEAVEEEQKSTESGTVLPTPEPTVDSREDAKTEEPETVNAPSVEEPEKSSGIFESGCRSFNGGTLSHKYIDSYRSILSDICSNFEMDYSLVNVIASPRVNRDSLNLYVDNNVFGLTYWDKYVDGGLEPLTLVVLMEEEQDWWNDQLDNLLTLEPEWFGPTDGGGHCYAAEAEAFCPKAYWSYYGETTGNNNVLATMLGSRMDWNTFRKVVPIHEATHQFQTTVGLGHWRWWYVEGQATYFELASTVLVPGLGASSWRDQIEADTSRRDQTKFTATTVEETYAHMNQCNTSGQCNGFRYFAGSLAHELLVNTYGVNTYIDWNRAIARDLPDFKWYGMSETVRQAGNAQFASLFEDYFGVNIDTWERTDLSQYILAALG